MRLVRLLILLAFAVLVSAIFWPTTSRVDRETSQITEVAVTKATVDSDKPWLRRMELSRNKLEAQYEATERARIVSELDLRELPPEWVVYSGGISNYFAALRFSVDAAERILRPDLGTAPTDPGEFNRWWAKKSVELEFNETNNPIIMANDQRVVDARKSLETDMGTNYSSFLTWLEEKSDAQEKASEVNGGMAFRTKYGFATP